MKKKWSTAGILQGCVSQVANFCDLQIFVGCEFSQCCETNFSAATVQVHVTVHLSCAFDLFDSFVTFWFASHFTFYVIVVVHVFW